MNRKLVTIVLILLLVSACSSGGGSSTPASNASKPPAPPQAMVQITDQNYREAMAMAVATIFMTGQNSIPAFSFEADSAHGSVIAPCLEGEIEFSWQVAMPGTFEIAAGDQSIVNYYDCMRDVLTRIDGKVEVNTLSSYNSGDAANFASNTANCNPCDVEFEIITNVNTYNPETMEMKEGLIQENKILFSYLLNPTSQTYDISSDFMLMYRLVDGFRMDVTGLDLSSQHNVNGYTGSTSYSIASSVLSGRVDVSGQFSSTLYNVWLTPTFPKFSDTTFELIVSGTNNSSVSLVYSNSLYMLSYDADGDGLPDAPAESAKLDELRQML